MELRITSGEFTANGNFSGYTATGKRVHIFERQMKAIGIKKGDDLNGKFPLFAVAELKSYGARVDAKGQPIEGAKAIENRLTATAVFLSKENLIEAVSEDRTLGAEVTAQVKQKMASLDLSEDTVNALLNASVA